ncbi:MAG: hypothetical protein ABSH20_24125 [Tepidisphaeraceae bacterium]|jgi:predicted RNA binding protein YcfA (HicA-like mRNA interferase family)
MPKPAKEVGASLLKKGFVALENDHTHYHLYVEGKKTIVSTMISHGEKEIGDPLLATMARQVKLTRKQFIELVDCPLTLEQYVKQLRDAGHVAKADPPRPPN